MRLFKELEAQPLKKTWESKKFYPHFSLGIPKKVSTFFGHSGKEDMGIPKSFDRF